MPLVAPRPLMICTLTPTKRTVVTNVPGAPFQLYMCGAELVDCISLGPCLPNVGLFHIVYSSVQNQKGTITLSFTACRDMLPDPAFYAECLAVVARSEMNVAGAVWHKHHRPPADGVFKPVKIKNSIGLFFQGK